MVSSQVSVQLAVIYVGVHCNSPSHNGVQVIIVSAYKYYPVRLWYNGDGSTCDRNAVELVRGRRTEE